MMNNPRRIAVWAVALLLILGGSAAVFTQILPQGKASYPMPALKGPIAAVFGVLMIGMGLTLARSLWISRIVVPPEKDPASKSSD